MKVKYMVKEVQPDSGL